MKEVKEIPELQSYEEMAAFWDTHSLADYGDDTEPAEFEISPYAKGRYLVAIEQNLLVRARKIAHTRV